MWGAFILAYCSVLAGLFGFKSFVFTSSDGDFEVIFAHFVVQPNENYQFICISRMHVLPDVPIHPQVPKKFMLGV